MEKNYKEKITEIRETINKDIISLMNKKGIDTIHAYDLDKNSSPIISKHPYDYNDNYTLDRIVLENGELTFEASNLTNNDCWNTNSIDIELLAGVAEWLFDHEDNL